MFIEDGQIIKIDALTNFLDIREAFVFGDDVVGKICLQFRVYDKNRPKGQKITQQVDFFMDSEEASYFAEIMKTGRICSLCRNAKAENKYAPGYHKYGGTASRKISKQLKIESTDDGKLFIKALEGPGTISKTGAIAPAYKDNDASQKVAIKLTQEQAMKIGLQIERAIAYFDHWNADGIVKEKTERFRRFKADEESSFEQRAEKADDSSTETGSRF